MNEIFSLELTKLLNKKQEKEPVRYYYRHDSSCNCNMDVRLDKLENFIGKDTTEVKSSIHIPLVRRGLYRANDGFKDRFFDTEEELIDYVKNNDVSQSKISIVEYLGLFADQFDVIRETFKDGSSILYTAMSKRDYAIYVEKSDSYNEYYWLWFVGSLRSVYAAFQARGIVFKQDRFSLYAKEDERCEYIKKLTRNLKRIIGK